MSIVSTTKMTAKQFLRLGNDPPGVRLELVDGEIAVSPSSTPSHSFVVMSLALILGEHIRAHALGELHHDVDTLLDHLNIRRPDLLFFTTANSYLIGETAMEGPPDLAIEVISPSSITVDRQDKFTQYFEAGVRYYWLIDPELKTVEGWELAHDRYMPMGRAHGTEAIQLKPFADLVIPLARLWRK